VFQFSGEIESERGFMDLLMASFSHPSQGAEPEEPFDSSVDES
jgi:hypothetical protein